MRPDPAARSRRWKAGPYILLAGAVSFGLVVLWPETTSVAYLNDEAFHLGMAESAARLLRAGHDPLSSWYSLLNLGSPVFLHYQSLEAIVIGAVGTLVGVHVALCWSTYLLLSTWPVSMFACSRLLGWDDWTAAATACAAPFIMSAAGHGYDDGSYLWIGFGLWTQLWAMWTLPLAVGFTYQAFTRRRHITAAVVLTALTVCLHYETGYLALGAIVVLGLATLARSRIWRHIVWTGLLLTLAAAACSWVIVPVVTESKFAARNEFLQGTVDANSFGARRILGWLVTGQLFDKGRLPVLTVVLACGVITALATCGRDLRSRSLLALFVVYLVLFFGRPTLGPLIDIVPGNGDLFLRRFVCGVDLAALLLVGVGARELARLAVRCADSIVPRLNRSAVAGVAVLVGALMLAPAANQVARYAALDGRDIRFQQQADAGAGRKVQRLIAVVRRSGAGRVYAGLPTNWGESFRVGLVPVYAYLADEGVDSIGFTLRTASLMSDAEPYFDDRNAGDYDIFGVRYLLLPASMVPPVPADPLAHAGPYRLFLIRGSHEVEVGSAVGRTVENRTDIGVRSASFLHSPLPGEHRYLTVAFVGQKASRPFTGRGGHGVPGVVNSEKVALSRGRARAVVTLRRAGIVVLSASFDPGWTVTVDGRPARIEMVTPALPAVRVSKGRHLVVFAYRGYRYYAALFLLTGVALLVTAALSSSTCRQRTRRPLGRMASESYYETDVVASSWARSETF